VELKKPGPGWGTTVGQVTESDFSSHGIVGKTTRGDRTHAIATLWPRGETKSNYWEENRRQIDLFGVLYKKKERAERIQGRQGY